MKRIANAVTTESRTVLRLAFRASRLYMSSNAAPMGSTSGRPGRTRPSGSTVTPRGEIRAIAGLKGGLGERHAQDARGQESFWSENRLFRPPRVAEAQATISSTQHRN